MSHRSQNPIPPEYFATYFLAEVPGLLPARFGVITAHNPNGRLAAHKVNVDADAKLKQCLERLKLRHFRVTGGSQDGSHREPGFGVVVDDPKRIEALTFKFQQEAFFWIQDGEIYCIKVGDSTLHPVGFWQERQLKNSNCFL